MKKFKLGVILLALLLASMAMVPMVSAEENSSGTSQTQPLEISTTSLITFDDLSTTGSQMLNEMRSSNAISSSISKYETLEIDAKTLKTQVLSGKQIPIHLKGVSYFMDLHEETFYPSAETGVYTFNGKLVSAKDGRTIPESSVHLTLDDSGILGHLSVDSSETIYLDEVSDDYPRIPEQQIAYSSKDVTQHKIDLTNDLIVELASGEIKPVAQLSDDELAWLKTKQEKTASDKSSSDQKSVLLDSMVDVNLLIATDNTMYSGYSNWKKRAQSVLDDANTAFGVNSIKIRLVPIYDDSKRMELSQNFNPASPFPVFADIFDDAYLNSQHADIAMYLCGIPFTGSAIGLSKGFDSPKEKRQSVMSYEGMPPGYVANAQDRAYVFTHELGHLFDGAHENASNQVETYNRAIQYTVNGVERHTTMWSTVSQDPLIFSTNDGVHGDASHNNALRLKETKGVVSAYAS